MGSRLFSVLTAALFLVLGAWLCVGGLAAGPAEIPVGQRAAQAAPIEAADAAQQPSLVAVPAAPAADIQPEVGASELLPAALSTRPVSIVDSVEAAWAARVAAATGIPLRAVLSYAGAALALQSESPSCGIGWTTIAAIGATESGHGSAGGSLLGDDGLVTPRILGPRLDGTTFARIADTDGGSMDGDVDFDRAVGPMQFIPSTWADWGADGNGDGIVDPHNLDDASLATGRYLCSYGDISSPQSWRSAVFGYNHDDAYVDRIAGVAAGYDRDAG